MVNNPNTRTAPDTSAHKALTPRAVRPIVAFEAIGVGRTTGFGLLRSGQLRSVRFGRIRLVPVDAIDEFMDRLGAQDPKQER